MLYRLNISVKICYNIKLRRRGFRLFNVEFTEEHYAKLQSKPSTASHLTAIRKQELDCFKNSPMKKLDMVPQQLVINNIA